MSREFHHRTLVLIIASILTAITACGDDDTADDDTADDDAPITAATTATQSSITVAASDPPTTTTPLSDPRATTPPPTLPPAATAPPTDPPAAPPTTVGESWRNETTAWCAQASTGLAAIAPPASPDDVARFVEDFVAFHEGFSASAPPEWPSELSEEPSNLNRVFEQADGWIDRAVEQLDAGTVDGPEFSATANGSIDHYRHLMAQSASILAMAGVRCGPANPVRMANADLNVPVFSAYQVETGFGSVWVSSKDGAVHRIDPDTGAELAEIEVGSTAFKLQPADGRMIVRTSHAYVAIDPVTNTVVDTLAKADVGPTADRSWAVDGALWICDGQRVHRYDPLTFGAMTTIELGFDCGQVYATPELVIPWSYNQDDGESGTSVAALVDPATNSVHANVELPVDVGVPIVLDQAVFFPPYGAGPPVVIDRADNSVASTADLPGETSRASQSAYDGTSIYVVADDAVAVVDPITFEVTDTIQAFNFDPPARPSVSSVAVGAGALWAVNPDAGVLQRFGRPT